MKKELLSPAGDMKSLYQAVAHLADAVYISGKDFGARKFAPNFSRLEIKEAVGYCHLYGVRLYVTVNTLIHDSEISSVMDYISYLYEVGVDALIMQDLGIIKLVRETYPDFEIHASTQLHNHNKRDLELLKSLGVKRCVLARELSIDEIKELGNIIELEMFIHGALCISYSGQCLFSSFLLDRSGNRGECAGFCRLPYTLVEDGKKIESKDKYLLSPKELNTLSRIDELLKLPNVTSFKIEGRMKSPGYVGFVTSLYRKLIDSTDKFISEEDNKNLAVLYNRKFTEGYLFNKTKEELMNPVSPNHIGIPLGQVISFDKKYIKIKLTESLHQEDGIRFANQEGMIVNFLYDKDGKLISSATKGMIVSVLNKVNLKELGLVRKTLDSVLLKNLENLPKRTIPITGKLVAQIGKPLRLEVSDEKSTISLEGAIVEVAKTSPTSKERLTSQVMKTNDTPFVFTDLSVILDNVFVPIKEINELRRKTLLSLIEKRLIFSREIVPFEKLKVPTIKNVSPHISCLVRNREQYEVVKKLGIKTIYVTDSKLYEEVKNEGDIYLRTSRVIKDYPNYKNEKLLIGEIGGLSLAKENEVHTDYFCHAYNHESTYFFLSKGVKSVTLSVELKKEEVGELLTSFKQEYDFIPPTEVIVYGRIELMIMKHCLVSTLLKEKPCSLCKKHKYSLEDRNQKRYPLQMECPYTHIFHHEVVNHLEDISYYIDKGVSTFRIELFDETEEEIKKLVTNLRLSI